MRPARWCGGESDRDAEAAAGPGSEGQCPVVRLGDALDDRQAEAEADAGVVGNEPWHYELRRGAVDHGCPTPYADPTDDPGMQR